MPLSASSVTIPSEVREFCLSHGLTTALETALEHLSRAFPEAEKIALEVEQDPEVDYRRVNLCFEVAGTVAEVHSRYLDCSRQLTRALGLPAASLIRVSYSIGRQP